MNKATKTLIAAMLLATAWGCTDQGASIGDDGVYFGELGLANPRMEDDSYYATHTIALAAGEELNLTMQSTDFDAYLQVRDSDGNTLGEDDDSAGGTNASLIVVAPEAGTYTIIANAFSEGESGEYMLAVRRRSPDASDGVFSGVLPEVDGKSFSASSYPRHEVAASAGDVLDIQLTSGSFDAYVEVEDSRGNIIAEDDDGAGGTNSRLSLPIRSSGTYTVVVKSFGDDGSGPYTLSVRNDEGSASAGGNFETFDGELSALSPRLDDDTPYEAHVIEATAGEELDIGMSSDDFDSYLQLWSDRKSLIASDDDSGGGLDSQLTFVVPTDARYLIVANSVGSDAIGDYEITVRRHALDLESGKVEILSGTLSGTNDALADGTPTASHEIEAQAGDRLDITMMAGDFDAYLLIFDADDQKLSEDDDSGGGTNARLSVVAPTDGTYRVVANSYDQSASGSYTITVRRN